MEEQTKEFETEVLSEELEKETEIETGIPEGQCDKIKIGDIELISSTYNVNILGGLIIQLLKDKEVREYLELKKAIRKATTGSYLG